MGRLEDVISLRCTVMDADHPDRQVDVDVVAPSGATASDLTDALAADGLLPPGGQLAASGLLVPGQAPLGRPPLVSGALLVAVRPGPPSRRAQPHSLLELHVVGGPDSGRVLALSPGTSTIGRSATATLSLEDPDLSREHLFVTLDGDGLVVGDLGSSNGTTIDGSAIGAEGERLLLGRRVRAGSSTLAVRSSCERPAATYVTDDGTIMVSRGPRTGHVLDEVTIPRPACPVSAPPAKVPWVAVLVPLLACVPLALLTHQPTYLLLGLMGPLTIAATSVAERRAGRRADHGQRVAWQAADDEAARRLEVSLEADLTIRRTLAGDAAELLATAKGPGFRLWERGARDADRLELVVGQGQRESAVVVTGGQQPMRPMLSDAPVVVDLAATGHLGIWGEPRRVAAVARLLVARLCLRTTPRTLRLVVLAGRAWHWTRWLPHRHDCTLGGLAREVRERLEAGPATAGTMSERAEIVALVDDVQRWAADPSLATVLHDGPGVGVHVICLARSQADLPSACPAMLCVPRHGVATLALTDEPPLKVEPDGVATDWAEDVSRALAPLRDATPDPAGLPDHVTLQEVSAVDPFCAADVAAGWRRAPRTTSAVLGARAEGALRVDLVRDGPHALVAGTTGAGKSELLQTLVTSLAVGNRPDELAFVLIDYKGGAAFRELSGLPHVVGLVTDLDAHLAERALASLQAELTRRERLLGAAGSTDVAEYQAKAPDDARLARLVLVVDEFRLLATELPQFLDGLVRLAAVGRSLGVHLVLATQRPAGVVSADIKANVNLRICLRVRDRTESDDVLDAPDAALVPIDSPGRALLRAGADALVPFQVALAGVRSSRSEPEVVHVRRLDASRPPPAPACDVAAVVRAVNEAARSSGVLAPASPWLPPLPDAVRCGDLHVEDGVAIGLVDLPDEGRREVLGWDPVRSSHLAVSGTSRTGRTTALLTVALELAEAYPPDALHLHVLETGDALSRLLAGLPHLGTTVSSSAPRSVGRLVTRLSDLGAAATTVLLVDGWESLVESLDRADHGQRTDALLALLRDGEGRGLRAVVAGGRGVLTSRLAGLVGERLLLRCADPTDLLLAGAPSSTPLPHQPPGRVVHLPSGREAQLAWPGGCEEIRARVERVRAAHRPPVDGSSPLRLRELPRCHRPAPPAARREGLVVEIGVGGDAAEPLPLDLAAHPVVAVAGPGRSGRSTALTTVAAQLHARGRRVVAVAGDESPLARGPWDVLPAHGLSDPRGALEGAHAVLVDDLDVSPDHWRELLGGWDTIATPRPALVVATTTDHLCGSFTGVGAAVRRNRTGVLLHPARPSDGEPFGVSAEAPDTSPPGRGLLVVRGRATPLQVALPPSAAKWGTAS